MRAMSVATAGLLSALAFLTPVEGRTQASDGSRAVPGSDRSTCDVTLTPQTVPARAEPVDVTVRATGVGTLTGVEIEGSSGIQVLASDSGTAGTLELRLGTETAVPGGWDLVAKGDAGSCKGQIEVSVDEPGGVKDTQEEQPIGS